MSSKPPNEKPDSSKRATASQLMVTRHQSAQQKRQLRNIDRSMKRITSLLKSPERSPPKKSTTNKTKTTSPPSTMNKNLAPQTALSVNKSSNTSPKTYGRASPINKSVLLPNTANKSLSLPSSMETKSLLLPKPVANIKKTVSLSASLRLQTIINNLAKNSVTAPVAATSGRRIKVSPKMAVKLVEPNNRNKDIKKVNKPTKIRKVKTKTVISQGEFYPETKKREGIAKKIRLRHKYALKCIGKPGSGKRKLCIPQKGCELAPNTIDPKQAPTPKVDEPARVLSMEVGQPARSLSLEKPARVLSVDNPAPGLSVNGPASRQCPEDEMLRMMMELDESMTDEDMMEILTCPSPVWWEDPPDSSYTEEPVYSRSGNKIYFNPRVGGEKRKRGKNTIYGQWRGDNAIINDNAINSHEQANKTSKADDVSDLSKISTMERDENFYRKRNTLEGLLRNIKGKKMPKEVDKSKKETSLEEAGYLNEETGVFIENVTDNIDNDEVVIFSCYQSENITTDKKDAITEKGSRKCDDNISIISIGSSKCSGVSMCVDKSEDDILNDLENLEIPIRDNDIEERQLTLDEANEFIILDDDENKPNENVLDNPVSDIEGTLQLSIIEGTGDVTYPDFKFKGFAVKAESPKTLIWTSNDGDKKIVNLVSDGENMTSDEATETEPCEVPRYLPKLQKFQKVSEVVKRDSIENNSLNDIENSIQVKGMTDDQISDFVSAVTQTNCIINEKTNLSEAQPDLMNTSTHVDLTDGAFDLTNVSSTTDDIETVENVTEERTSDVKLDKQQTITKIKSIYKQFFKSNDKAEAQNKEIEGQDSQKQHRMNVYKIIDKNQEENRTETEQFSLAAVNNNLGILTKDEKLTKLVRKQQYVIKVKKNMLEKVMQAYAT